MESSDFTIQSVCFPVPALQDEVVNQVLSDLTDMLQKLPLSHPGYKCCIVDIARKMLPVLEDIKFTTIWIVLLDKLASMTDESGVAAIYELINEKQATLFTDGQGRLPVPVMHRLWLTHLPSLEFIVLALIRQLSCEEQQSTHCVLSDMLKRSHLAAIAAQEPVIYHTIVRMLESLATQTDSHRIITDLLTLFVQTAEQKQR